MVTTTVSVEGLRETEAALRDLGKSLGKAVARRVVKRALQPVADRAKATVEANSKRSGGLAESIVVTTSKTKAARRVTRNTAKAGRFYTEMTAEATAPHAHLIEFGTGERFQKKSGRYTGRGPAEPFMRPAWDAEKGVMPGEVGRDLWVEISKAAARKAKRAAKLAAKG